MVLPDTTVWNIGLLKVLAGYVLNIPLGALEEGVFIPGSSNLKLMFAFSFIKLT